MAREIRQFSPTVPANTPIAAGWTADLSFPPRTVERIQIRVPPGPGGYVGFAIGAAGTPVIPYNEGEWIVTDDEVLDWPLEGQHDSGSWTLFAYNTGRDPHTIYVRFLLNLVPPPAVASPLLIPHAALAFGGT